MAGISFGLHPFAHSYPNALLLFGNDWHSLDCRTRARFAKHAIARYCGTMHKVECSFVGMLFALVCRLFGTPLAWCRGSEVPTEVFVYPSDCGCGLVWERCYRFAARTIIARSVKTWHHRLGLMECVSGGLGMALAVRVSGGAVHFRSQFYFVNVCGVHVRIPSLMTPGATEVVHRDLGDGSFQFEMTIDHSLLGRTFYQIGTFVDPPR